jgi:glycosyltransferase involved in cell wall biosynthesis
MRIVHVTSYQIPGAGYEEIYLAREQVALGHDVTILTSNYLHPPGFYAVLSRRVPQRQVAPSDDKSEGVRIVRLASREIGGRVWLGGLERQINEIRPDIVHCHNVLQFHPMRLALMKAAGRCRFALVVDGHMQTSLMRGTIGGKLFYGFYGIVAQPLVGRYVAHYSAKNDDARHFMETACGIRRPIEVITLGVDTETFVASNGRRHEWRSRVGIPENAVLFLNTGKLIPAKGLHLLIGAAIQLLQGGSAIHVAFVGDSEPTLVEAMRQRIKDAGFEDNFHFQPGIPHSELPSVYAAADVGVWPRLESIAVLEALSSSLPVIINSSSSYAALIHEGAGLVFDSGDRGSLARAMLALCEPLKRDTMGAAGRQIVERSYSWRYCAQRYLDAYRRSLDPSPTPS